MSKRIETLTAKLAMAELNRDLMVEEGNEEHAMIWERAVVILSDRLGDANPKGEGGGLPPLGARGIPKKNLWKNQENPLTREGEDAIL
jgi:hypothetical protein